MIYDEMNFDRNEMDYMNPMGAYDMPMEAPMPPQPAAVLLNKLTALDFMAVDMQLYLDTHPMDREALELYNTIVKEAAGVRQQYEAIAGPLCSFRSPSKYPWQWIKDPWPWSARFNFAIEGKE